MASDDVHRLRDILVEEVSLVDRAANKRRFLLVKREGDMSELRSNGRGGFTSVRKSDDEPEDTEKKKKPFPGAAKPFGDGDKPDPDDDEEKRKRAEEEKRKAKADPDPDDDPDEAKRRAAAKGAKLSDQVGDLADELSKLADEMEDDEEDEPSDVNMKKLLAAHRKIAGMADAYLKRATRKSLGIAKIGRKMSAARLAMYKEALETLQSLLAELMDSPAKDKTHDPDPGDPQVAPPGWKSANPSDAPTNAKGVAAIKNLQGLLKGLDDTFAAMNTTIAQQGQKIAKLEKGVTPSNALRVDGGGTQVRKGADVVVWPMDLNARAGRDKVDKSVSFLEDD